MSAPKETDDEIVWRRFGRDHENPCNNPNVTTCALWQCQVANACQLAVAKSVCSKEAIDK